MTFALDNKGMSSDSYRVLCQAMRRVLDLRRHTLAEANADFQITVSVDETLADDRYRIHGEDHRAILTGANDCAVHAAMGHFLRASEFDGRGSFLPMLGDVDHTPAKKLRGLYMATHFYNFYHKAPLLEVYQVIEDQAMRGCNCICVWFDMHHYTSMEDVGAQELAARLRAILSYGKRIGMKAAMTMIANEAFDRSPLSLRARWEANGRYHTPPADHYHLEICPSKEGGIEQIVKDRKAMLAYFADLQIDYVVYWPYDQGGCTCEKCQPWGSNGFLRLLTPVKNAVKELIPHAKMIVSTWYFDHFVEGEWDEFYDRLVNEPECFEDVAYVMAFFHHGNIPPCIREKGIPQGVEFVDFPEISMQYCSPWGGYGASVLAGFLQETNTACSDLYQGGFPYSEGIFEDANKFIEMSHYSGTYPDAYEALRAYVAYEFCCKDERLYQAVKRTEIGLERRKHDEQGYLQVDIADTSEIDFVYEAFVYYNDVLPGQITQSAKFQLYYLRSVIDFELKSHGFVPGSSLRCQEAMREVNRIYHADQRTKRWVCAPVGK